MNVEITEKEYKELKKKYNLKSQEFKGISCNNCGNEYYKVVTINGKHYYECTGC